MSFLKMLMKALTNLVTGLLTALPDLIKIIVERIRDACRWQKRYGDKRPVDCLPVPAGIYLRPDPSIYSQSYLMSLGMAVTWENPDVSLTDLAANVIGSHDLLPSTKYIVKATIHNRSNDAPAPGMPVNFSLISFGIGGNTVQEIGTTSVNLPVRGAPGEPALATMTWTTPPVPGHYCILIDAIWPPKDDANPLDNTGTENTVIRGGKPGKALVFTIPVRNTLQGTRKLNVHLNSYVLPERSILPSSNSRNAGGLPEGARRPGVLGSTTESLLQRIIAANAEGRFPAPADWIPELSHRELTLESEGTVDLLFTVTVPLTAPVNEEQRFNIAVTDDSKHQLVGGVTIICQVQ